MTRRDAFLAMMAGERGGPIPLDLPMSEPVRREMEARTGFADPKDLGSSFGCIWADRGDRSDEWRQAYDRLGIRIPREALIGSEGRADMPGRAGSMGRSWHLTEMLHPLKSLESLDQVAGLPWHDPADPEPLAGFERRIQEIKKQGLAAVISSECTCFEQAWYCRSMDALFEDLALENGIAEWLLDHFTETSASATKAAAAAGVDLVRLGDDVGTQRGMLMSASQWRKVLKPRLARVIAEIREAAPSRPPYIQYHSDGCILDIIDDLIEIGVDIINPVQPECMNLDHVVETWKDRLAFSGMIGTQTTMPFGSPDDVRREVRRLKEWIHRSARMIIGPTHLIEPDVPWENVMALVQEAGA